MQIEKMQNPFLPTKPQESESKYKNLLLQFTQDENQNYDITVKGLDYPLIVREQPVISKEKLITNISATGLTPQTYQAYYTSCSGYKKTLSKIEDDDTMKEHMKTFAVDDDLKKLLVDLYTFELGNISDINNNPYLYNTLLGTDFRNEGYTFRNEALANENDEANKIPEIIVKTAFNTDKPFHSYIQTGLLVVVIFCQFDYRTNRRFNDLFVIKVEDLLNQVGFGQVQQPFLVNLLFDQCQFFEFIKEEFYTLIMVHFIETTKANGNQLYNMLNSKEEVFQYTIRVIEYGGITSSTHQLKKQIYGRNLYCHAIEEVVGNKVETILNITLFGGVEKITLFTHNFVENFIYRRGGEGKEASIKDITSECSYSLFNYTLKQNKLSTTEIQRYFSSRTDSLLPDNDTSKPLSTQNDLLNNKNCFLQPRVPKIEKTRKKVKTEKPTEEMYYDMDYEMDYNSYNNMLNEDDYVVVNNYDYELRYDLQEWITKMYVVITKFKKDLVTPVTPVNGLVKYKYFFLDIIRSYLYGEDKDTKFLSEKNLYKLCLVRDLDFENTDCASFTRMLLESQNVDAVKYIEWFHKIFYDADTMNLFNRAVSSIGIAPEIANHIHREYANFIENINQIYKSFYQSWGAQMNGYSSPFVQTIPSGMFYDPEKDLFFCGYYHAGGQWTVKGPTLPRDQAYLNQQMPILRPIYDKKKMGIGLEQIVMFSEDHQHKKGDLNMVPNTYSSAYQILLPINSPNVCNFQKVVMPECSNFSGLLHNNQHYGRLYFCFGKDTTTVQKEKHDKTVYLDPSSNNGHDTQRYKMCIRLQDQTQLDSLFVLNIQHKSFERDYNNKLYLKPTFHFDSQVVLYVKKTLTEDDLYE